MLPGIQGVVGLLGTVLVLLHVIDAVQSRGERKVHFRFHTADLVNSQTHTRTLYLPPGLFHSMQHGLMLYPVVKSSMAVAGPQGAGAGAAMRQPVSYMRQTVYIPRGTSPQSVRVLPIPGQLQHGFRPVVGHSMAGGPPVSGPGAGPSGSAPMTLSGPGALLPVRLGPPVSLPLHHIHMHVPIVPGPPPPHHRVPPGTHHVTTTSVFMAGPPGPGSHHVHHPLPVHPVAPASGPAAALHQPRPSAQQHPPAETLPLIPMSVFTFGGGGSGGKSAALRAPSSAEELTKNKGCSAFVKGSGDELAEGDCFLEEYEKGYNEEQSKKTFFGDENSDLNTEKEGERQSRRYKNQQEYEHHPKLKHEWVEAPRGRGRPQMLRTSAGKSMKMVSLAKPVILPGNGKPATVALIRLPPGTAKLLVRPASSANKPVKKNNDDESWDDDDEPKPRGRQRTPMDSMNSVLDDEDPDINPVEQSNSAGLVEVFKQSARSVPSRKHVIRPIWMETFQPLKIDKDDDFDVEESSAKPMEISKLSGLVAETRMSKSSPLNDDGDGEVDGWTAGFNEDAFHKEAPAAQNNEFDVDFDEEMKGIQEEDVDDEDRKEAAAANVRDSFTMMNGKGRAEKMLHLSRAGPLTTDHEMDSPRLSAILASGGHVFPPSTPPAPHPAAFGVKDPDRLEVGRKAPIVVEFGHELSGFKVTQEKEQKRDMESRKNKCDMEALVITHGPP